MSAIANIVKGCPLFYEIYDNEIEQIIEDCVVARFEKGEAIIKQGDEDSDICVVLDGKANISVTKGDEEVFIATIQNGDIFGEMVLINETKRTANITAEIRTDILVMSSDTFYSIFSKNPKVFGLMVLNVTRLITKRLKYSNQVIQNLNHELAEREEKKAS
jgi:CRP/FNR family cyclic AMP-dependent transcriptional regulator